ncbi:TPA: type 1 fimbrial protein [Enterobacter chengduensis]|nr:type 1 fimbrial protein [Enterobacter chengduensis]
MNAKINNKTLLAFAVATFLPAGTSLAATTSGGTVNFSGSVVTSACAISAGSSNVNVDLGEVRTAALSTPNSEVSAGKTFSIALEDCDIRDVSASTSTNPITQSTVSITFDGTPDVADPTTLAVGSNGGTSFAQNVSIRLYDEQGKLLSLGTAADPIALRKDSNTLNFSAKYFSMKGGATAGDASAVATYTVTYS